MINLDCVSLYKCTDNDVGGFKRVFRCDDGKVRLPPAVPEIDKIEAIREELGIHMGLFDKDDDTDEAMDGIEKPYVLSPPKSVGYCCFGCYHIYSSLKIISQWDILPLLWACYTNRKGGSCHVEWQSSYGRCDRQDRTQLREGRPCFFFMKGPLVYVIGAKGVGSVGLLNGICIRIGDLITQFQLRVPYVPGEAHH